MNKELSDIASLFTDAADDLDYAGPVKEQLISTRRPIARAREEHIGCPLAWFDRVRTVVKGRDELVAALLLYRERFRQRDKSGRIAKGPAKSVPFSNFALTERGINRCTKSRMLNRLARAGLVSVDRTNHRSPVVKFHD